MNKKKTVIVKRNPSYEKGKYNLTIPEAPGADAQLLVIESEEELRQKLTEFGFTIRVVSDLIELLQNSHDSVTVGVTSPT